MRRPRWQQDIIDWFTEFFPFRTNPIITTIKLMAIVLVLSVIGAIAYDEVAGDPAPACTEIECLEPLSPPYPQEVH